MFVCGEKCCEWLVARRKERAAVSQEICNANCEEDKEGGTWAYFEHFLRAFCTDMCPFVTEKWFNWHIVNHCSMRTWGIIPHEFHFISSILDSSSCWTEMIRRVTRCDRDEREVLYVAWIQPHSQDTRSRNLGPIHFAVSVLPKGWKLKLHLQFNWREKTCCCTENGVWFNAVSGYNQLATN